METNNDLTWQIRNVVEDHDRGAAAIGKDLQDLIVPWKGSASEGKAIAHMLVQAKPVMSPILHIANHLLGAAAPPAPASGLGASGLTIVSSHERSVGDLDPAVQDGMQRIMDATSRRPLRVMTYSASGTVEAVLAGLQPEGHLHRVYLSEAQPGTEGRSLAGRLAAQWGPSDTEVILTHDAALPALLPDVDLLLLGADLLLAEGIVNKVGTATLVERAHRLGIPVVVLAAQDKAPPVGVKAHHLPLPLATEAGQLTDPPTGVRTVGLAFEWVDLPRRSLPGWADDPDVPDARPELVEMLSAIKTSQTRTEAPPGPTPAGGAQQ